MKKIYTLVLFSFGFYYAAAQVGIGTDNPKAGLHVADSSVVFTADGDVDEKGTLPIRGRGRRFFWFPGKAAFRSGYVDSDHWDKENIGNHSFGAGYNVIASGPVSVAIGDGAMASNYRAVAMGTNTLASGYASTAFGEGAKATGDKTTAMGYATTASGEGSMAIGTLATARGIYSIAMGIQPVANGDFSIAMGGNTVANGKNSTVMGLSTVAASYAETAIGLYNLEDNDADQTFWNATDRIFSVGNGTDSDNRKNAMTILKNGNTGIGISAPEQKLEVEGNVKSDALLVATVGGTASPFNYYEESTSTSKLFNGPVTYLSSYSVKIVRVGKLVTISFSADALSLNVTANDIVFSSIPERFRPSINQYFPIRVVSNGSLQMGLAFVQTNGDIFFKPNASGGSWGGVNSGFYATSVSYVVN